MFLLLFNSASILDVVVDLLPNEFIMNESFESPVISPTKKYKDMTEIEKEEFKWVAGGGLNGEGPTISDGDSGYVFPTFVTGQQALAMRATSFIQQDIYLNIGTYIFSTYFISRNGTQNNPIEISINGTVITTINQVVDYWKLFTHTFDILIAGNKTLRLEGTSEGDVTIGIDLVALSRTKFEILLETISKTPYAYFRAKDYDPDTREIPAFIGDFTAETTGDVLTVGPGAGNGADASIPFLNGTVNSIINFKVDVPVNFTVCSITRYSSSDPVKQDGILVGENNGNSGQFIHGHWYASRGVAYYKPWMTSTSNSGLRTEWLVMCGKNESTFPNNILADNNAVGTSDGGNGGQINLGINNLTRPSDFAFNQIIVWDTVLTDAEMQEVSNYLTQYLVDGLD